MANISNKFKCLETALKMCPNICVLHNEYITYLLMSKQYWIRISNECIKI